MALDTSQIVRPPPVTAATANPKGELGKDAFMKLLIAELKQQDPMDPMKAREMVGQLSELATVEKLTGIEDKLTALQSMTAIQGGMDNAGLIGRTIVADRNTMTLGSSAAAKGQYDLSGNADSVQLTVRNANGDVVYTEDFGAQKVGPRQFEWDGSTTRGDRAPDGTYTFEIAAKAANGQPVAASTRVSGIVSGVSYDSGSPEILVGDERIPLGDVTTIRQ